MNHSGNTESQSVGCNPERPKILDVVLNLIIPPSEDGRLPGAAEYDVWGYICRVAGSHSKTIRDELDRLEQRAYERFGKPLDALEYSVAQSFVDELRALEPEFLADLARQTVSFYYQQDRVLEAIGVEARAPYPQGFEVISGDLSLLDPVRRRGTIYRKL
tara:strand:- start:28 stop:507 length:480 start_codon:yes stop_codon:yes gene_type:complete